MVAADALVSVWHQDISNQHGVVDRSMHIDSVRILSVMPLAPSEQPHDATITSLSYQNDVV